MPTGKIDAMALKTLCDMHNWCTDMDDFEWIDFLCRSCERSYNSSDDVLEVVADILYSSEVPEFAEEIQYITNCVNDIIEYPAA